MKSEAKEGPDAQAPAVPTEEEKNKVASQAPTRMRLRPRASGKKIYASKGRLDQGFGVSFFGVQPKKKKQRVERNPQAATSPQDKAEQKHEKQKPPAEPPPRPRPAQGRKRKAPERPVRGLSKFGLAKPRKKTRPP